MSEKRHFEVHATLPPDSKAKYPHRQNITCHVVAQDAVRALSLVLGRYPEADVWSLQHRGKVDIIEDAP